MKKIGTLLVVLIIFNVSAKAQYSVKSPYLVNPEKAIGFVDSCATFWLNAYDSTLGGFFTNIDKYGDVLTAWGTNKNMLTQTRDAYGFVRAYMLTGNDTYLQMAREGLNFLYEHGWDNTYGGWFRELDINGNVTNPNEDKTAFDQHYALLGPSAYYEATQDTTHWSWLLRGYNHNENIYWDDRASYLGYYDVANFDGSNPHNKSFNATVDAITTHLLYLYLMTEDSTYKDRLKQLAEQIINHMVASMDYQAIGFVERYDSDWNWDNSYTMTVMGHVLKAAWCLGRLYQIYPDTSYISAAEKLALEVWQNGYDHQFGGPYKDYNRVTGEMLMWGNPDTTKAWWQLEQALTGGLVLFEITGDSLYLQMADESLDFFMKYFVDHQYGEVYNNRTRYGGFAWNEAKGDAWKAGYHSIELGYYVYLYGKLFVTHEPVTLHYDFVAASEERNILLTPLAIVDSILRIEQVVWNGQPYADYDPDERILNLPAEVGGHFEVTYARVYPTLVVFNDSNLEQAVRDALGIPTGNIYDTDMATLTSLTAQNDSISDLTGLEYAANLDTLNLSNNQISDIKPLQYLTNLTYLNLSYNQISDITALQNLIGLTKLLIYKNQIGDITALQSLPHLVELSLSCNQISDISVLQNLTKLTYLSLGENRINDITVLQNLTDLTYLYLYRNQISDITALQNLTSLITLFLHNNLLDNEDLTDLYNLDSLTGLNLRENPGIISGTAMQTLGDNLDLMNCEDILWDGTCGVDPNIAVICWVSPPDSTEVGQTVTVQATATDSGQAQVQMKIDWGDGDVSDYSELKANGSTFEFTHSYTADGNYDIKVIARNQHGAEVSWSDPWTITVGEPTIAVDDVVTHSHGYFLYQNYPNPFDNSTVIKYSLKKATYVNLSVYDISGRHVKTLISHEQRPGEYSVSWNGTDNAEKPVTNGIYFYRIDTSNYASVRKMILTR